MITITNPGGLVIIVKLTKHENKRINNNKSLRKDTLAAMEARNNARKSGKKDLYKLLRNQVFCQERWNSRSPQQTRKKSDPHTELDNLISTELDNCLISTELDSEISTQLDNCQISTQLDKINFT